MNFLQKIFSPVALALSITMFFFTFYNSEIHYDGIKRSTYLIYYKISLLLIVFSLISFFIKKQFKEYLIIFSLSSIFGLYIFEAYLINKNYTIKKKLKNDILIKEKLYEKISGKKWDKRSKLQVYKELKIINTNVVINVNPINYSKQDLELFPFSGISNSHTIYCNENGYYKIYLSDRFGFNNPDKEWDEKNLEYLIIGDSFASGACVNRPYDIGSVLRKITKKSVLNLGYGSMGPLVEYATLREYLNQDVKKILWIYYEGNDLRDLREEKKNKVYSKYINDLNFSQNLKYRQNEIDNLAYEIIEKAKKKSEEKIVEEKKERKKVNNKINFLSFLKLRNFRNVFLFKEQKPKDFKSIIKLANELAKKNNSKLYFIYLPTYSRYVSKFFDDSSYNFVKKIVIENKIPFIDISKEVFAKEKNPLTLFPFKLPGHYTQEGYDKVAKTIFELTKD